MGLFDFFKKKRAATSSEDSRRGFETQNTHSESVRQESTKNSVHGVKQEPIKHSYYRLEEIKSMRMGESLMIAPYDASWLFQAPDSQVLPLFANSEKIRRFLPGLGFETEESCRKQLETICIKTEGRGLGFTYFIRQQNFPIRNVD